MAVSYQLNDKIILEMLYYSDLDRLLRNEIYTHYNDERADQLTIGIKYVFNRS